MSFSAAALLDPCPLPHSVARHSLALSQPIHPCSCTVKHSHVMQSADRCLAWDLPFACAGGHLCHQEREPGAAGPVQGTCQMVDRPGAGHAARVSTTI